MKIKNKYRHVLLILIFLLIQTLIYIIYGINKQYIHMDEAYSLGLSSYNKVEIQDNEDFYNTWHNKEYYEDYISVQEDEITEYKQVYENQKNDVHPPFYYLILRFAMGFTIGDFSKWPGIIVNIIIYIFITIFMYSILQEILREDTHSKEKSIILSFLSSITIASISNVIYIRMYSLATLNILITTFLHIKLLESKDLSLRVMLFIGVMALVGSLTHYYYLFYLVMLFIISTIKYIKRKEWKKLELYISIMAIVAVLSLLIFPHSMQHIFWGDRGQGTIASLTDILKVIINIFIFIWKVNYYGFNNLLFFIVIAFVKILQYKKKHKININKDNEGNKELLEIIYLPTIFYFIIVSIVSPFAELRYIMPVCGLVFILVIYYLEKLLRSILNEKEIKKILVVLFILIVIAPIIFKIAPETLYLDNKIIVEKLGEELNVPAVYLFNSKENRFLDDILLFSKLNESYIAKDIEYTEENIQEILKEKDISKGLIIFINKGQENNKLLNIVKKATGFKKCEHLKKLNESNVYYFN